MDQSVRDVLAAKLAKLPPRLSDAAVRVADRGNVQLNLPALLQQHRSSTGNDTTAHTDNTVDQQPSHEAVLQLLSTVDWQVLQVTALDVSGWDLQLAGWKQLLGSIRRANAMRKLVLSNCNITGDPGEEVSHTAHTCVHVHTPKAIPTHNCSGCYVMRPAAFSAAREQSVTCTHAYTWPLPAHVAAGCRLCPLRRPAAALLSPLRLTPCWLYELAWLDLSHNPGLVLLEAPQQGSAGSGSSSSSARALSRLLLEPTHSLQGLCLQHTGAWACWG